jgi:hypothetical protein
VQQQEQQAMSVREMLNQYKGVVAVVALLVTVAAVSFMVWASGNRIPGQLTRAYFSDDDGKTYFVDDAKRICPFDHNGKPAVHAYVFNLGAGEPTVVYLSRYTESARAKLTALGATAGDPDAASQIAEIKSTGMEVKKPGDKNWVGSNSAEGMELAVPKGVSGAVPHEVYP